MADGELELLPLEREDLEFLRRLRNDPAMSAQLFSPSIPISSFADRSTLVLIANVSEGPVGYGQIKHIDYANRSVELGFHIAPEHQGKGRGTALVKKLVEFASTTLNMHRLYLQVFASNAKAIHVYEKCGFVQEGIQRDKVLKDGRFRDVMMMSIIHDAPQ